MSAEMDTKDNTHEAEQMVEKTQDDNGLVNSAAEANDAPMVISEEAMPPPPPRPLMPPPPVGVPLPAHQQGLSGGAHPHQHRHQHMQQNMHQGYYHHPHGQGYSNQVPPYPVMMHHNQSATQVHSYHPMSGYPVSSHLHNKQTERSSTCRMVCNQATCELPSMEEFPGNFDFHVHVARALDDSKRHAWEFSDSLHKLFAMEGRNVPIQFKVKNIDPTMFVRAVAIYCDPDSSNKPVLRCPNHLRSDDPLNKDYRFIDHVIQCDNQHACYERDPRSDRRSVSVSLGVPQPGSEYVTVLYAMMCRSSCKNGIDRRGLALVFTLEINGRVIGRQVLPVRVCASPHRDRILEEKRLTRTDSSSLVVKEEGSSAQSAASPESPTDTLGPLDQMYFVPVNNCDDYVVLARLAKELVLRDYPEGPLKEAEIHRYQSILNTMGENQH